jgi:5-oxoprolinase (ATP-hydrolysing)
LSTHEVYTGGRSRNAEVFDRKDLRPGDAIAGPAVIREDNATTVVEPGWRATFTARGDLVLDRIEAARRDHAIGTRADPVLLEVFNNLFMAIAEQMGVTLANTAYSVNIKGAADFSHALFDADGNLIANAPHMPVHPGRWASVRTIINVGVDDASRRRCIAERSLQRRTTRPAVIAPVFRKRHSRISMWRAAAIMRTSAA